METMADAFAELITAPLRLSITDYHQLGALAVPTTLPQGL